LFNIHECHFLYKKEIPLTKNLEDFQPENSKYNYAIGQLFENLSGIVLNLTSSQKIHEQVGTVYAQTNLPILASSNLDDLQENIHLPFKVGRRSDFFQIHANSATIYEIKWAQTPITVNHGFSNYPPTLIQRLQTQFNFSNIQTIVVGIKPFLKDQLNINPNQHYQTIPKIIINHLSKYYPEDQIKELSNLVFQTLIDPKFSHISDLRDQIRNLQYSHLSSAQALTICQKICDTFNYSQELNLIQPPPAVSIQHAQNKLLYNILEIAINLHIFQKTYSEEELELIIPATEYFSHFTNNLYRQLNLLQDSQVESNQSTGSSNLYLHKTLEINNLLHNAFTEFKLVAMQKIHPTIPINPINYQSFQLQNQIRKSAIEQYHFTHQNTDLMKILLNLNSEIFICSGTREIYSFEKYLQESK